MSTIENPRPLSRRTMLTGLTAAMALGASTAVAVAETPDPALAEAEAERIAWEAFGDGGALHDEATSALWASPWDRKPRVLIGEHTCFVRGPNFDPIPLDERVPVPIYAHTHEEIDRDCDMHELGFPSPDRAVDVERRARLHRELDADAAAIEAAPEVIAEREADARWQDAHETWKAAALDMVRTVPTTTAGLLAIIHRFETYTDGCMVQHAEDGLTDLLATIRTYVSGRA